MEISRVAHGGAISSRTDFEMPLPVASRAQVEQVQLETKQDQSQQDILILSKKEAQAAVDGLNKLMTASNAQLKFEYHEKLREYYVTLVDGDTKEVVREIPPKKLLDMVAAMWQQIGIIVDKKM